MTLLDVIRNQVEAALPNLDKTTVDFEAFQKAGVVVVRNVLSPEEKELWIKSWSEFYQQVAQNRQINEVNPVDFKVEVPAEITEIYKSKSVLNHVKSIVGENIGLYGAKVFVKDKLSPGEVFLHQDFVYQHGNADKVTMFMALNNVTTEAGSVRFYLGTHKFGYMADAGELKRNLLPDNWPVLQVNLAPGDMVLMHCMTWHDSPINSTDEPRVVVGATFQDAEDISSKEVLMGKRSWESIGSEQLESPATFFVRSRGQKLKELYAELEQTKN